MFVEEPADSRTAFPFCGGESTALERLHSYLWESDSVAQYKETRNGMIGADYSTKFSPWSVSTPQKLIPPFFQADVSI